MVSVMASTVALAAFAAEGTFGYRGATVSGRRSHLQEAFK
jgi:hypothetical protein